MEPKTETAAKWIKYATFAVMAAGWLVAVISFATGRTSTPPPPPPVLPMAAQAAQAAPPININITISGNPALPMAAKEQPAGRG